MNREQALPYVSFGVDDALASYTRDGNQMVAGIYRRDIPANAVLVGWQAGFELLFVAVWSYLPDTKLEAGEAEELARDLLQERRWFADNDNPPAADYVLT